MRCEVCSGVMIGRSERRYCSGVCRQRAFRARRAARHAQTIGGALQQLRTLEGMMQSPLVRAYLPPLRAAITLLSALDR